jgi:8-oxo-dGTP diphosphatase
MESEVHRFYGNKIRVRACGLCFSGENILLINHSGITASNFWSPPGGGVNFGESVEQCLKREFLEETGLSVDVMDFLFACELVRPPLHAIELFFKVQATGGHLRKGTDPEPGSPSIIKELTFMAWHEIESLPSEQIHGIFGYAHHPSKVEQLRGYFRL